MDAPLSSRAAARRSIRTVDQAVPTSAARPAARHVGARQPLFALGVRAAFVLQSFAIGVVLTRLLSPDDVGAWFSLISATTLITAVLGQGLPIAVSRGIATVPGRGREMLAATVRRSLVPWVALCVVLLVVGFVIGQPPTSLTSAGFVGITIATLITGPQLLERIYSEGARGAHVDWIGILGDGVFSRSLFTVLAAFLLVVPFQSSLLALVLLLQVSIVAFIVLAHRALVRRLPVDHDAPPAPSVYTSKLWMHAITIAFLSQGDLFLSTFFLDGDQVADYAIAWRLGGLVTLPLVALTSVVPGRIYDRVTAGDYAGLQAMMATPMRRAAFVSVLLFVGLVAVGQPVLSIFFGDAYTGAYVPMIIIGVGQLVSMWSGPVGYVLIGARREGGLVVATTTSAIVLAALVPIGAQLFQETGVALAMAVSMVTATLIRNRMAQRTIGGSGFGSVWRFRTPTAP